jgi:hypothetical protein
MGPLRTKLVVKVRAARSKWAEISFEKKISMFVAPVVVAVVTAVILRTLNGDDGNNPQPRPLEGGGLEVAGLAVRDSTDDTEIDVAVRNSGELVAVANRASFRITEFRTVGACLPGAYLLPSHKYELVLPVEGAKGKVLTVDISQKVEPNDADRFTFRVSVETPQLTGTTSYLYGLEILLFHDAAPKPIPAGSVVLAKPFPADDWFSSDGRALPSELRSDVRDCAADNRADLSAILALPGARSPELLAFGEGLGLDS